MAFYGESGHRWAMTERGRASVRRQPQTFRVGPSSMAWDGEALVIDINEVTVPQPGRLRGKIRLEPITTNPEAFLLSQHGRHFWQPVAPLARVSVEFDRPRLSLVRLRISRHELG